MTIPSNLVIDWTHVLELSLDDIDRMADVHLFSRDLGTVLTVKSAIEGEPHSLTIGGETLSYTAQANDDTKAVAQALITAINSNVNLHPLVAAEGPPAVTEKSLRAYTWFGASGDNQLEIRAVLPFAFFPVSGTEPLKITPFQNTNLEPIRLGGRSRILEQVANRTLQYKNSRDLFYMQANLAAHIAAQNLVPAPGQGTISSETFEGEGMSWTMPTNNPRADQEKLMTVYGKRYLDLIRGKRARIYVRKFRGAYV